MRTFLFVALFTIVSCFAFLAPVDVFAQEPIVPCNGPDCQTCHFVQLGNNVLKWIIGVMSSVCAIIIIVAGLKMATAGGNSGAVSEAKGMITNVIVGFVILLAAWLIVDTVLRVLISGSDTGGDAAVIPKWGPWNEIKCVDQPLAPATTGQPTGSAAGQCSIRPLTPITDTEAMNMERMNGYALIWTNTDPQLKICANKFASRVGGSVVSAYRPQAYQDHLKQVHTRWCLDGLSSNTEQACAYLKAEVSQEMRIHTLSCSREVGTISNHTSGRAVDISGRNIAHGSPEVLAAAAASCLDWRLREADPVHYELKSGCTCN